MNTQTPPSPEPQTKDPRNPFKNTLENTNYRMNYARIVPYVLLADYKLPLFPDVSEKRGIRSYFNTAGAILFLSVLAEQIIFIIVYRVIYNALGGAMGANGADAQITDYISSSSIFIGMNALIFFVLNSITAAAGCKSIRVSFRDLFQTESLRFGQIVMYLAMGVGIQVLAGEAYSLIEAYLLSGDTTLAEADFSYYSTAKSTIVAMLYTCILAPLTEELLYRGFVMKALSCVSVRFGIIVSALVFGLAHGNVEQFVLAFPMGLLLGKITARHNSLAPALLTHMGINTIGGVMNLLDAKFSSDIGQFFVIFLSTLYYAMALMGGLYWLARERKEPMPYETQAQHIRNRVFWSSPLLLLAFGLLISVFALNQIGS